MKEQTIKFLKREFKKVTDESNKYNLDMYKAFEMEARYIISCIEIYENVEIFEEETKNEK